MTCTSGNKYSALNMRAHKACRGPPFLKLLWYFCSFYLSYKSWLIILFLFIIQYEPQSQQLVTRWHSSTPTPCCSNANIAIQWSIPATTSIPFISTSAASSAFFSGASSTFFSGAASSYNRSISTACGATGHFCHCTLYSHSHLTLIPQSTRITPSAPMGHPVAQSTNTPSTHLFMSLNNLSAGMTAQANQQRISHASTSIPRQPWLQRRTRGPTIHPPSLRNSTPSIHNCMTSILIGGQVVEKIRVKVIIYPPQVHDFQTLIHPFFD